MLHVLTGTLASAGMLILGLTAAVAQGAVPQGKGTAEAPYLRLEWEFESARGAYQNACGRVYNDRDVAARHVVIVFDGFDSAGKKVSSRWGQVVGDVPARGFAVFCLQVKSGGATYQVSLPPGVEWGSPGGQ
jgi:hypothetical protein